MDFLNRHRELAHLEERYARNQAEIAILYGRRRVGKSALLYHFQLAKGLPVDSAVDFADWAEAFRALGEWAATERAVVVIDEFPYLVEESPSISTTLQELWDRQLQHTQLYLALTGSVMGVMLREAIDVSAPLYKRHTWPLFAEPLIQLHEELRSGDPTFYMRILAAISQGHHRRADIANHAALPDARQVDHYLATLMELGLIERRLPLSRRPAKRSWGLYHLADPFYRFWHRWVLPRREVLEIGHGLEPTLDELRHNWPQFVAPIWEELARVHLYVASGQEFPFFVSEVGSWWSAQAQIDVVGVNRSERRVILGEVKWLNTPMTVKHLNRLMEQGQLWLDGETGWDVHYALFSRSGFGPQLEDVAMQERDVHLFSPETLVNSGV